jgi:outer membrane usher protein
MTACAKRQSNRLSVQKTGRFGTLLALALVAAAISSPATAQQARVTNPYGRDVEFTVALREQRALIGEVSLHIALDGTLSLDHTSLTAAITNRVTPEALQALLQLETQNGRVSVEALARMGYNMVFNDADLELAISIPLAARPRLNYSIMGSQREQLGDFDPVSFFSFAANVRLSTDYSRSKYDNDLSTSGTLHIVGRVGPVAYQSSYRIPSSSRDLLHEGSHLIVDDIKRALRWQFGDVRPFSASPLGGEDVLGFGVSRETDTLQPDTISRVRGAQTFSLQEASEVTVSVNGRVVSRSQFAPGNYNIADFPFVIGRNQIELLIQNQAGEQERLSFNQYLDSRLLEAGRDDFGFVVGIASRPGYGRARSYDYNNWTLNAHYIKGVSEKLTLGIATTMNQHRTNVLATGVHAGLLGITSGRLGLNLSEGGGQIGVMGLGLVRILNSGGEAQPSRTLRFGLDGRFDFKDSGNHLVNASIGYAWPMTKEIGVSVDLRLSGENGSASFQTSYSMTRQLRLDVSLDWRFNKDDPLSGPGISIGLSRSFGAGGQSRARYDSWLNEGRLSVSSTPKIGLGQWSNTLEAAVSDQSTSLSSSHSALFNRFEVATSLGGAWRDGNKSQRASLRVGSALAFANGQFAIGRPVSDSFAIIKGHKSLEGRVISLASRGSQSGTMARTGLFGPALVSSLGTYSPRIVSVTLEDQPLGYDLGSGTFRVAPPLFGGYGFVVGSDSANTVVGTLLLANGKPAALVAGSATSPDWPGAAPIIVFTNANGQFSVSGLGRGRWSLTMRGVPGTFDFTIGAIDTSYTQVGEIRTGGR